MAILAMPEHGQDARGTKSLHAAQNLGNSSKEITERQTSGAGGAHEALYFDRRFSPCGLRALRVSVMKLFRSEPSTAPQNDSVFSRNHAAASISFSAAEHRSHTVG